MTLINSFLQPLLIRFHERNQCFNCSAPARDRCKCHGTKICADIDCRVAHRRAKRAVYGDLTRPFCEYSPYRQWEVMDFVVAVGSAVVVGVGVAILWVHL